MKKTITFLLIFSIIGVFTGCGKIKDAVKASAHIARQTENLVDQNIKSYNEGLYSKETARQIANVLDKRVIPLAVNYNNAVIALKKRYNGTPPKSEFAKLANLFDAFDSAFLELLQELGNLSTSQTILINSIIEGIQTAISVIRDTFATAQVYYSGGDPRWA